MSRLGKQMERPFSIKVLQQSALETMLRLNAEAKPGHIGGGAAAAVGLEHQSVWKVLVYDNRGLSVISPVMKVGQLRASGVTLYLSLHSERDPIPDVPAVYFVEPTEDNIKRIVNDAKLELYDGCYVNFVSHIEDALMDRFAELACQNACAPCIESVHDQYVDFIALEDDMFSLRQKESFFTFNNPHSVEADAMAAVDRVVNGLYCTFATLGQVPIIRCPKASQAAAMVAQALQQRFRRSLDSGHSAFGARPAAQDRPVLLLMDRSTDLSVMVHHTWTYQALISDLLSMDMNRVQFEVMDADRNTEEDDEAMASAQTEAPTSTRRVYDLDASVDEFWCEHRGSAWPEIPEELDARLSEYNAIMAQLDTLKDDDGSAEDLIAKTKALGGLVQNVGQIREKKRLLDTHVLMAHRMVAEIKARELDKMFMTERAIMGSSEGAAAQDVKDMLLMLSVGKGTAEDKMRLFIIYYTSLTKPMEDALLDQFREALTRAGCDMGAFDYVLRLVAEQRGLARMHTRSPARESSFARKSMSALGRSFRSVSDMLSRSSTKEVCKLTQEVDMIMRNAAGSPEDDAYTFLDPCAHDPSLLAQSRQQAASRFTRAVVFVVGGGSYVEYQNLRDYGLALAEMEADALGQDGAPLGSGTGTGAASPSLKPALGPTGVGATPSSAAAAGAASGGLSASGNKPGFVSPIWYGCTEVLSPNAFLAQLNALGKQV